MEALKCLILIHLTDAHIISSHLTITLLLPPGGENIEVLLIGGGGGGYDGGDSAGGGGGVGGLFIGTVFRISTSIPDGNRIWWSLIIRKNTTGFPTELRWWRGCGRATQPMMVVMVVVDQVTLLTEML